MTETVECSTYAGSLIPSGNIPAEDETSAMVRQTRTQDTLFREHKFVVGVKSSKIMRFREHKLCGWSQICQNYALSLFCSANWLSLDGVRVSVEGKVLSTSTLSPSATNWLALVD